MKSSDEILGESFRILMFDTFEEYQQTIEYLRVLESALRNTHALNNLGVAHYEIGEFEDALVCFTKAITLDERNAIATLNRAELNVKLGNQDKAEDDFTTAIHLNPKNPTVWRSRAYFYKNCGKLQRALDDFRKALLIDSGFEETRKQVALLEKTLGLKS